jgi:hypothetical protein
MHKNITGPLQLTFFQNDVQLVDHEPLSSILLT